MNTLWNEFHRISPPRFNLLEIPYSIHSIHANFIHVHRNSRAPRNPSFFLRQAFPRRTLVNRNHLFRRASINQRAPASREISLTKLHQFPPTEGKTKKGERKNEEVTIIRRKRVSFLSVRPRERRRDPVCTGSRNSFVCPSGRPEEE